MDAPYKRSVTYLFTIPCLEYEPWEVVAWTETRAEIVETRKNGQEDCHLSAMLVKANGAWSFEYGQDDLDGYVAGAAAEVLAHFNKHGAPPVEPGA